MYPSQSLLFVLIATAVAAAASLLPIIQLSAAADDYSNLVFKGCADQSFQDPNYRQTLANLLNTLISQSSSTKFYQANSSDGSSSAITGLFQCRGDLSNDDCNRCLRRTPDLAQKLCGAAMAVRVQLSGCYLSYEISGFRQTSGTQLLYKVCGSNQVSGTGFEDRLGLALGEVVKGVGNSNGGFYTTTYQSVYVLGQCEGDLSGGDCASCVKSAIDSSKSECSGSISAQIYLHKCYISYAYYPSGVPNNRQPLSSSTGTGMNTQKTVAIVLGGLVGVGLLLACLLFTRSTFKKKTHTYKYGG